MWRQREKGELNSRADFRLRPRGEERGRNGFRAAPEGREEGGGGEEREEDKERGEISSRADFRLSLRGVERGRTSRADFRPPPMGKQHYTFFYLVDFSLLIHFLAQTRLQNSRPFTPYVILGSRFD